MESDGQTAMSELLIEGEVKFETFAQGKDDVRGDEYWDSWPGATDVFAI